MTMPRPVYSGPFKEVRLLERDSNIVCMIAYIRSEDNVASVKLNFLLGGGGGGGG